MDPQKLPEKMAFCYPTLEKFQALCREFEVSPAVLALSFVLSVPGVTTAVLGCDTPEQAAQNCQLFDQTIALTNDQMEKLHEAFHGIDPRVINPGCWYNHT